MPDVWDGVVGLFRDYGYRRLRHRARIKFLVADWGVEKFREVLENEYLAARCPTGRRRSCRPIPGTTWGCTSRRTGGSTSASRPWSAGSRATRSAAIADVVEAHGSHRVRTTPHQKLLVLDVEADQVESLIAALDELGLSARPSVFRRNMMACTGIEFCKLAIVETKGLRRGDRDELESRLADVVDQIDVPITMHVNGCPNSCARIQIADIGLKGQIVTIDGEQHEGFQVHLGGGVGLDAGFGRKVRGLKVTAAELPSTSSGSCAGSLPSASRASASPPGSPAPMRRRWHERDALAPSCTAPTARRRSCARTRTATARGCACRAGGSSLSG